VESGQDPSHFWRLTLREIAVILDGAASRLKREHNDRAWMAWHIAALSRQKKMAALSELTFAPEKVKRQMTPQELEAVTRSWLGSRKRKS
jgi:hypothetical protein